jgi:hypothetical protein
MPFAPSAGPILLAGIVVPGTVMILLALGPRGASGAGVGPLTFGLLALWAALVAADERALGPIVFREPLVAAGVSGVILGRPMDGVLIGALFQWVWPGLRPIGGSREPAAGLGSLVALAWLVMAPREWGAWRVAVAVGGGMAAASGGPALELLARRRNELRESLLLRDVEDASNARLVVLSGLAEAGGMGALACALWVGLPALLWAWRGGGLHGSPAPAPMVESTPWRGVAWGEWGAAGAVALAGLMFAVGGCARGGYGAWRSEWRRIRDVMHSRDRGAAPDGARPVLDVPDGGAHLGRPGASRPGWRRVARLLIIQACYSGRFQQRCGFLWLVQPTRRAGSRDAAGGAEDAARVAFAASMLSERSPNTHPLMAAALAGALERVLGDAQTSGGAGRSPARLVQLGGGLLAQWGDRVLWGGLRPFVALMALVAAAAVSGLGSVLLWVALALALEPLARSRLYAWGRQRGWSIVPFRPGRLWRAAEVWMAPARLPLALTGAILFMAVRVKWPVPGGEWVAPAGLFVLGFALGGGATRRPLIWGWMSAVVIGGAAACAALL